MGLALWTRSDNGPCGLAQNTASHMPEDLTEPNHTRTRVAPTTHGKTSQATGLLLRRRRRRSIRSSQSKMSFRAREIYKKVVRRVGGEGKLPAEVMDTVKNILPNSKVVMGRAKRGIFAGRHIQFGNKVSEDGGNKYANSHPPLPSCNLF